MTTDTAGSGALGDNGHGGAEPPAGRDLTAVPTGMFLIVAGLLGLAASAVLTIDKFRILADPGYKPGCSINAVVSCGSVMTTRQAEVFGFPNSLIGIAAFAVVITVGVIAAAQVPLPRWIWIGLWAGTALGVGFVHWLMYQTLYEIGALCPYCMVVWLVTVSVLASAGTRVFAGVPGVGVVVRLRWVLVAVWVVCVVAAIWQRFGSAVLG